MVLNEIQEQAVRELLLMAKVAESIHESTTSLMQKIIVREYTPNEDDVELIRRIKKYMGESKDDLIFREDVWNAELHRKNKQ